MPDLLQIDLAVGVVLIILATVIIVLRARRDRHSARPREVAELAGEETAQDQVPVVPGFSEGAAGPDPSLNGLDRAAYEPEPSLNRLDRAAYEPDPSLSGPDRAVYEPDPGAREPEPAAREPEPAARESEPAAREPEPGAREPEPAAGEPDPGTNEAAGPQQAAPVQVSVITDAGPDAAAPAAEPDGPPGADGAVTSTGRVSSYYEGADQPVADYLAELGWAGEPGAAGPS